MSTSFQARSVRRLHNKNIVVLMAAFWLAGCSGSSDVTSPDGPNLATVQTASGTSVDASVTANLTVLSKSGSVLISKRGVKWRAHAKFSGSGTAQISYASAVTALLDTSGLEANLEDRMRSLAPTLAVVGDPAKLGTLRDMRATKVVNGRTLAVHVLPGFKLGPMRGLVATVDGDTVFTTQYEWTPNAGGWVLAAQRIEMRQSGRVVGTADIAVGRAAVEKPSMFAKAGAAISNMLSYALLPAEAQAQHNSSNCFYTFMESVFVVLGWAALSLTPAGIVLALLGMGASGIAVLKTFENCAVLDQ